MVGVIKGKDLSFHLFMLKREGVWGIWEDSQLAEKERERERGAGEEKKGVGLGICVLAHPNKTTKCGLCENESTNLN